ncbi:hypothetical protein RSOLAG1IB_11134 [Rhizoctonia solani AG-1 IB]|uniref:Uncharacterized protein n=1 Tax=Thanatephorus cucumeris (strain AG1-IB / isolate 7/3/14) TaxID=1108050 RepID=A0A0B7F5H6_THACB|nr:hypothetical protein RSOLAG1IB_11134 [Rhizoctonia solani AG-1 IB]
MELARTTCKETRTLYEDLLKSTVLKRKRIKKALPPPSLIRQHGGKTQENISCLPPTTPVQASVPMPAPTSPTSAPSPPSTVPPPSPPISGPPTLSAHN